MKESCPALRIIYLSRSMLPSRAANSVHVMKMCRALARNGHDVTLVASKARQCPAESIYGYYGVEPVFKLAALGGRSDRVPGLLLYLINCLLYLRKEQKPDIIYGRDIFTLFPASSILKVPFFYEAHKPPTTFIHSFL